MVDGHTRLDPDAQAPHVGSLFDTATQLGRDLAAVDWASTPLGPVDTWPAGLRNTVRVVLASRFSMWMAWGPELTFFCNDAYRRDTLGAKYPWALGKPASEVWSEIWPDLEPRVRTVIGEGIATWDEALMLFLERSGYPEETYHTFSYSPIADDDGTVRGLLCVVSEDTARVISERRMEIVRRLGTALAAARTRGEVYAASSRHLVDGTSLPFVLGYVFDDDHGSAELAWRSNVPEGHPVAPPKITVGDDAGWPVSAVLDGRDEVVEDLPARWADVPTGAWDQPPLRAMIVPLAQPGADRPLGFLIAALNRYRRLDDDYHGFLHLIAGQVSAAITRARAYEEERHRAEELAELDRAKTAFFTNVSHELRTPLTLLLGPASDALDDRVAPLPAEQRARVEIIQRNAERLLKLVNTLLDFSRIESGRLQARFEPLDLSGYTSDLAAMFESAVERAGLALTVQAQPLSERVFVDREMWAKVVLNLLSNALKATFTGEIAVRFGPAEHGGAELVVSDTGVGIPAEEQQRLFERFHRVRGAALRTHEGSGIGLALVHELVDLHGGTVTVCSTPGEGSTFTVRIPGGTNHLPADQVFSQRVDEIPGFEQYGAGFVAEATRWVTDADEATRAHGGTDRPYVLVVDDNVDMRNYIAGLLQQSFEVTTAADGVQALESARARTPDLVLTDVMMPRLDGFGLLAELRADPSTLHVPVVMLSARSGDEATVEGLEAGADDYLVKPFSSRELTARVRANLELDRARRVAAELARSRTLLDQAEELAHVGSWELDLRENRVRGSAEYFRILGMDADAEIGTAALPTLLDAVDPGDRERVADALARTARTGSPLDLDLTVVRDGERRHVRAHGLLHRHVDGTPSLIRGSAQDVTEQRRAEKAMAATAAAREAAAREHLIADELQRSLLPGVDLSTRHVDVAAYYRSGVEGTQAGGDWYDVIDLGGDRAAFVIGDVMGRGVRAAAVMGQLRATVRAYARLDLPPGALLAMLDAAVADMPDSTIVTCVYAVHDARTGQLTYGNAGHPPPLLRTPGAGTTRLEAGDPPLGAGAYRGTLGTVTMAPDSVLLLYTDGLVEHRGTDLDAGIASLAATVDDLDAPVEALPSGVVDRLLPHEPDDDVALLAVSVADPHRPRGLRIEVAREESAVGQVRDAAATALGEWGVPDDTVFDVLLIISELVTNSVRHGRGSVTLRMRRAADQLVIEVSDSAVERPRMRAMDPAADSGRGLHLIEALAAEWGTRSTGSGKAVWCVVPIARAQASAG